MEIKSKNKGFILLLSHPYNSYRVIPIIQITSNNKNKAHFSTIFLQ